MCQMVMTRKAISPSLECATLAAGMIWPETRLAKGTGKMRMRPVTTMMTLPNTSPQYSNFCL